MQLGVARARPSSVFPLSRPREAGRWSPDFESATSAIAVLLETRWSDTQCPCFQGFDDAALIDSDRHCSAARVSKKLLGP